MRYNKQIKGILHRRTHRGHIQGHVRGKGRCVLRIETDNR